MANGAAVAREPNAAPVLSPVEQGLARDAKQFLERGLTLKRRVDEAAPAQSFQRVFPLVRQFNPANSAYGFFDSVTIDGKPFPVIGNFQNMFFDRARAGERNERDQLREFVLRYFMRVSDFRLPEPWAETGRSGNSMWPKALSWCPEPKANREGFGFTQLMAKRRGSGAIERFPESAAHAVIDLREIGNRYDWLVTNVRIFDFSFRAAPVEGGPEIVLPLQEGSYLITSPEFITDDPENGRFGLGYAFIQSPPDGPIAWGPGQFRAAYEQIDFQLLPSGMIEVKMYFAADQPEKLASLELDPVAFATGALGLLTGGLVKPLLAPLESAYRSLSIPWPSVDPIYGFVDLANLVTFGLAAEHACISREQLYFRFLVQHFQQHFQTLSGALTTWRRVADWTDEGSLPEWVRSGTGV